MTENTLVATHVAADGGLHTRLGEVALDDDNRLSVVAASEDAHREYLEQLTATVNQQDVLGVKAPAAEDDSRYELSMRMYRRADDDFVDGIKDYAMTYYSVNLASEAELQQAPEEFPDLA